jgi:site-specific DNA recombinase
METSALRVVLYARVSSDEQRKGLSIEAQVEKLFSFAQENHFDVVQCFEEEYSGFDYERPEMDKIRLLAQEREIDAVIVVATDRYARGQLEALMLDKWFKRFNIRLFSIKEGEFTPSNANGSITGMQRVINEKEVETTKERLKEGRLNLAKAGIPNGQGKAAYGYIKVGRKRETRFEIVPDQAHIVQLIFSWYIKERLGSTAIAKRLNEMGILTPSQSKGIRATKNRNCWTQPNVRKILSNETYIGKLRAYRYEVMNDGNLRLRYEHERYLINVPVIIDEDTWNLSQQLVQDSRKIYTHRSSKHNYLMSRLLICSCGYAISSMTLKRPNKTYYKYRCNSASEGLFRKNCGLGTIQSHLIDEAVWIFVEDFLVNTRAAIEKYIEAQRIIEQQNREFYIFIDSIDELINEKREERNKLVILFIKGRIDEDYFDEKRKYIDKLTQELEEERKHYEEKITNTHISDEQLQEIESIGEEIRKSPEEVPFEKKRRILEKMGLTGRIAKEDGVLVIYIRIHIHTWRIVVNPT